MKTKVRQISFRKYWRITQLGKLVNASRFNENTWEISPLHGCVVYNGFLYFQEKTKETNFHLTCKKISLEECHKGAISYYV